jgi:signal transduction histidine kinase
MRRMPALLRKLRALPPRRFDALLALVVAAETSAESLFWAPLEGSEQLVGLGLVWLMALGVFFRRTLPFLAIGLALGGFMGADRLGEDMIGHMAGPFFAVLLITYSAGTVLEGRRLLGAALWAAALLLISLNPAEQDSPVANAIFSTVFVVAAPMLFGQLMTNRARLHHALRAKADDADVRRREEAAAAVLEERTRIAGELHDVVAHALSAMTVQAAGARRLATKDPDRARDAFAAVETTGREALTELRRLLGVLRKEDEELALAPQPSLAHVDALVKRWQASGLPVELEVTGAVRALPAGVDLTAFRLVQEALGGARDAGRAGRATVRIAYGAEDVRVDVADDGAPHGRRLLGMRERVAVYGGELATAPTDGGGWQVAARLPVEAPA